MKKITRKCVLSLMVILPFVTCPGNAQSIKRQTISSLGAGGYSGNLFVSHTVGQPFFTSGFGDSELRVNPGFQQAVTAGIKKKTGEEKNLFNLTIYPNPASHSINVVPPEVLKDAVIRIADIHGRIMYNEKILENDHYIINCSNWGNGIYFISVVDANRQNNQSYKVLISK